jgi:hypothetical protein
MVLVSAVILRSQSLGNHDHILLSKIGDSPNVDGQVAQEQGGPVIPPRHWGSFSSPPTTRWATVEVFDPASTRELKTELLMNCI